MPHPPRFRPAHDAPAVGKSPKASEGGISSLAVYMDSEDSMDVSEAMDHEDSATANLHGLVNNRVANVVTTARTVRSYASVERCLLSAGIEVECSGTAKFAQPTTPKGPAAFAARKRDLEYEHERKGSHSSSESIGERKGTKGERKGSKASISSCDSCHSALSGGLMKERELVWGLFQNDPLRVKLGRQHVILDQLVSNMFPKDDFLRCPSIRSGNSVWCNNREAYWPSIRLTSRSIITNPFFAKFFLCLTTYALFGPDLVPLLAGASVRCDHAFLVLNTVAFGLFVLELALLSFGTRTYACSMAFVLDLIALMSIFGDTWFMSLGECGELPKQGGTSERMTRLARLFSVAKVTRLLPRMMQLLKVSTRELARSILERKVWRAFLLLDTDGDGLVSTFDLKVFYFTVLQGCPHMLKGDRPSLLQADTPVLQRVIQLGDENCSHLDFRDFSGIFASTQLGREFLNFYVQEVEQEHTVWALTNRLGENVAIKVCMIVVLLLVTMSLLEPDMQDMSPVQGLKQLEVIARSEHANGRPGGTYLCDQIRLYAARHEVLYLFLDGYTHLESGQCLPAGVPTAELDPFERIETIAEELNLAGSELFLACSGAGGQDCDRRKTTSMSLLDQSKEVRCWHIFVLFSMVSLGVVLLIWVFVLKAKIRKMTEMFVNPLRTLADNMVALSSVDLLREECGQAEIAPPMEVAHELGQLQTGFESLCSAVRSWAKYVPPCVVERLLSQELEAEIGVASVDVSILFCDIDGFEDACKGLSPERVLSLLSDVLGKIEEVIQASAGTLLEFIGDEVLAVFNTPNFLQHHVFLAVASALEIHRVVGELPGIQLDTGKEVSIRCRCGVNTATVLAGNLGSKRRMKYGLLGDGVNLAARLKSLNSRYGTRTLVSDGVHDHACMQKFVSRPVDIVAVKGKRLPTTVYEVMANVNCCSFGVQQAAMRHQEAFRLYQERRFGEAQMLFEDVAELLTPADGDEASASLALRCAAYAERPPPADWDSVERLTKKTWEEPHVPKEASLQVVDEEMCLGNEEEEQQLEPEEESEVEYNQAEVADEWLAAEGGMAGSSAWRRGTASSEALRACGATGWGRHAPPLCLCGWWMLHGGSGGRGERAVEELSPEALAKALFSVVPARQG